jgi:tRNA nucleotidyltransferase (CCA-adding enzyme)
MLRAVRFEQRFNFQIDSRTLELLDQAISLIDRLSGERLRHELNHIFKEKKANAILNRLHELAILPAIHPSLTWDSWLHDRLAIVQAQEPALEWELGSEKHLALIRQELCYAMWVVRLPGEQAGAVCRRLRLSEELTKTILQACQLWLEVEPLTHLSPSEIVIRLEDISPLARYTVYLCTGDPAQRKALESFAYHWRSVQPSIDGNDLRHMGLRPGPAFRTILWKLRQAWLDGLIWDQAGEQALLQSLLDQDGRAPT